MGTDKNWSLVASPASDFKFNGFALEAGYILNEDWMLALHYDKYSSDEIGGTKVFDFHRIVPAVTYVVNQNVRFTVYYEQDLTDIPSDQKVNRLYLNTRVMF